MNYIEYTLNIIKENLSEKENALVIGAGFNPKSERINFVGINHNNVHLNDGNESIEVWCDKYKNSPEFQPYDLVVLSRVLEHFPIRDYDYYLYQLYTIMSSGAKLVSLTPGMPAVTKLIQEEFENEHPDFFKIKRLTFELFNEGPHIFDRHALWVSDESIRYYLEKENLFKIESVKRITVDTDIVPDQIEVIARRL